MAFFFFLSPDMSHQILPSIMFVYSICREEISFAFSGIASLDICIFYFSLLTLTPVQQYVISLDVSKSDARIYASDVDMRLFQCIMTHVVKV